jgi:hypothetical protein
MFRDSSSVTTCYVSRNTNWLSVWGTVAVANTLQPNLEILKKDVWLSRRTASKTLAAVDFVFKTLANWAKLASCSVCDDITRISTTCAANGLSSERTEQSVEPISLPQENAIDPEL